jgi:hypothetical protein
MHDPLSSLNEKKADHTMQQQGQICLLRAMPVACCNRMCYYFKVQTYIHASKMKAAVASLLAIPDVLSSFTPI